MKAEFRSSFIKDLRCVREQSIKNRIQRAIEQIEESANLRDLGQVRRLRGSGDYYRVLQSRTQYVQQEVKSMPEIRLQLPEEIVVRVLERAAAYDMTVNSYLTEIITRETHATWPERFFDTVVGGWKGTPLLRAPQGELEHRDML